MSRPRGSLYVRLSDAISGPIETTQRTGHVTQEADQRALAEQHGIDVVAVHFDNGKSGDKRNRAAWRAWLSDALEGRADVLIAGSIDRVSRGGLAGMGRFLDVLAGVDADGKQISKPVRFLSVKNRLDSLAPGWDMQVAVLSTMAKMERELIADRVQRSVAQRHEEGRFIGGAVPKGLRKVPNPNGAGSILEPDEPDASVVREVADRFISGDTTSSIVRWLNAGDMKPLRADHWSLMTAKALVKGKGVQEHLLSPAQRRGLAQRLAPDPDWKPGGRAPSRLLSGLALCDGCRRPMFVADTSGQRVPTWKSYRCQTYSTKAFCPAAASISASLVEAKVVALWLDGWGRVGLTRQVWMADLQADKIALLEDAVDEARQEVAQASRVDRGAILARLEVLETTLEEAQAEPVELTSVFKETGLTWGEAFEAAELPDQREMLRRTIGTVRVKRGRQKDTLDRLVFKGMVLGPGTGSAGGSGPSPLERSKKPRSGGVPETG